MGRGNGATGMAQHGKPFNHMKIKPLTFALLTASLFGAPAAQFTVAWDYQHAEGYGFKLYVHTNSAALPHGFTTNKPALNVTPLAAHDCGTNRQMSVDGLKSGSYWIGVTAHQIPLTGIESDWPSTNLIVNIPSPPDRTLVLETATDLSFTNAEPIRFFRLRIQ